MLWRWILGIFLILLLFLLLTRVGVQASMRDGVLTLDVRIGVFRFCLLPSKRNPQKEPEKPVRPQNEKKSGEKISVAVSDIIDAAKALWIPLKRALHRTRRAIRIHPLTISWTIGAAGDPASGAEQYGYLHAGIWTVMPVLEELLVIPEPSIHVGIDFERSDFVAEGEIGLSARVGTLLGIVLGIAVPTLRWCLRWQKTRRQTSEMSGEKKVQAAV